MWYKDERKPKALSYADSPDLNRWEPKGNAVTDRNGEGPKVFAGKASTGWSPIPGPPACASGAPAIASTWKPQDETLLGNHGDVVVSGDRAWWFYFTPGRRTSISVVELSVSGGKLLPGDPAAPTYIDLKPEREAER